MTDGPVTIREVYAIAEDIKKAVNDVDSKLSLFTTACAEKSGNIDKRISVLETKAQNNKEAGSENRGNLFTALMFALSSLVGAVTATVGIIIALA